MKQTNHQRIAGFICITIGLLFLVSGLAKLFPITAFEFQLVRDNLTTWGLTPFVARFLIIGELIIGLNLILSSCRRQIFIPLALSLLLFFSLYLSYTIIANGSHNNCGCFGEIIKMSSLSALVKNISMIAALVFAWVKMESKPVKIIPVSITAGLIVLLVFVIFPVKSYRVQFTSQQAVVVSSQSLHKDSVTTEQTKQKIIVLQADTASAFRKPVKPQLPRTASIFGNFKSYNDGAANVDKGITIVALLSLDCDHCLEAAKEIAALQKNKRFPNVYILFLGELNQVATFFAASGLKAHYAIIDPMEFFPFFKKNPPRIVVLNDGNIIGDWESADFTIAKLKEVLRKQ